MGDGQASQASHVIETFRNKRPSRPWMQSQGPAFTTSFFPYSFALTNWHLVFFFFSLSLSLSSPSFRTCRKEVFADIFEFDWHDPKLRETLGRVLQGCGFRFESGPKAVKHGDAQRRLPKELFGMQSVDL